MTLKENSLRKVNILAICKYCNGPLFRESAYCDDWCLKMDSSKDQIEHGGEE